jgi:hypothetical protein
MKGRREIKKPNRRMRRFMYRKRRLKPVKMQFNCLQQRWREERVAPPASDWRSCVQYRTLPPAQEEQKKLMATKRLQAWWRAHTRVARAAQARAQAARAACVIQRWYRKTHEFVLVQSKDKLGSSKSWFSWLW